MNFTFRTYDEVTIRANPTTQVAITVPEWPQQTFLLWLPEAVDDLWNQWTPEVAHQDFIPTNDGGLRWLFDRGSVARIEAEICSRESSLILTVRVTNQSKEYLRDTAVQNCFHLSAAPDFLCDDFSRIFIRREGQWRSLASLSPTVELPMYYRPGFLESGRVDSWRGRWAQSNQCAHADHPLIVCLSRDGSRCVGTASDDYQCLFHNRGCEYLRCIHSQQAPVPALSPSDEAVFRQILYFAQGGLDVCIAACEADIASGLLTL